MDKPVEFKRELNLGHLLTILSFVGSMAGILWYQSGFQTRTELELALVRESRERYVPVIDTLRNNDQAAIQRFEAITDAMKQIRESQNDSLLDVRKRLDQLADMANKNQLEIATMKARRQEQEQDRQRP